MSGRGLLKAGAILLGYPDPRQWAATAQEIRSWPATPGRDLLLAFLAGAESFEPLALEEEYVATFDFRRELSLYLTFHEAGESGDRSLALLALKGQLAACGYLCPDGELPDYIPLLLEFLAEREEEPGAGDLGGRLAWATGNIAAKMPQASVYGPLLEAIRIALPPPQAPAPQLGRAAVDPAEPFPLSYS